MFCSSGFQSLKIKLTAGSSAKKCAIEFTVWGYLCFAVLSFYSVGLLVFRCTFNLQCGATCVSLYFQFTVWGYLCFAILSIYSVGLLVFRCTFNPRYELLV